MNYLQMTPLKLAHKQVKKSVKAEIHVLILIPNEKIM